MQYRLRTLLIVLALGPALLAIVSGCQQRSASSSTGAVPIDKRTVPVQVKSVLDNADRLELFSFRSPRPAVITEQNERQELLTALYKGIEDSTWPAICFEPAFRLCATTKGETVELQICFECGKIEINYQGRIQQIYTSDFALESFSAALRRADVPLP